MSDVWIVVVERGRYSEFEYAIDGVYGSEADAMMRVAGDFGGTLSDTHSRGNLVWEIDDEAFESASPEWWDGWWARPMLARIVHAEVR